MRRIGVAWTVLLVLLTGCASGAQNWTPGPIITESVTPYVPTVTPSTTPSAVSTTAAAKPTLPGTDGAWNVAPFKGAHFASPTGRIWCALADDSALCHFPKGMKTTKVPKPSKVCPGAGLDVTGVAVSAEGASYFCSGGAEALPQVDGINVAWWEPTGFPKVLYDGQQLATLPYDSKLVDGDFVCLSAQVGITCGNTATGNGFLISRAGVTFIK